MQVIFVILLHIDYTLNAKYEIFLKYLLFKRKIPYFYYKKLSYHLHLSTNSSLYDIITF